MLSMTVNPWVSFKSARYRLPHMSAGKEWAHAPAVDPGYAIAGEDEGRDRNLARVFSA